MKSKVSVAIAAYNGADFIAAQLDSIMSQTLPPDEIIICDDSRDDATLDIVTSEQAKYPGVIKYQHNERRLGVSKNFERAISLATGEIIFLSDQDDVWLPEKIRKLATLIRNAPCPAGAFCNSTLTDANLKSPGCTHWQDRAFHPEHFSAAGKIERMEIFARRVPIAGHNMAFNAKLKNIILPFPDLPECHDTWIGLLLAATGGWELVNEELTWFRQHGKNVSRTGMQGQLRQALNSVKNNTFSWYVTLYDELIKRLSGMGAGVEPAIIELLRDRREYSAARAQMNCNIFKRLPRVIAEIRNRRYFKYGRGWKNVVQDIFLRRIGG